MNDDAMLVQATESSDGLKRWRLLRRPHGLFLFEEETLQDEIYHVDDDGHKGAVVAEA